MNIVKISAVAVALTAIAVLSGCAASTTVGYGAAAATIAPGESLIIDFGSVNPSVGDEWNITVEPDAAVADSGKWEFHNQGEAAATGTPSDLQYIVRGVDAGTTMIRFEYRFRGEIPENPADQQSVDFQITVE